MKEILALLKPRFWSFKNGGSSKDAKKRRLKGLLFGAVGLIFWAGIFIIFYRILVYFQGVAEFGDILALQQYNHISHKAVSQQRPCSRSLHACIHIEDISCPMV
jgi:hypothetical protein